MLGKNLVKFTFSMVYLGDVCHFLLCISNEDVGIVDARDTALNVDEVQCSVDSDDSEVLCCSSDTTHTTSHFLTWPDTTRIL